MEKRAGIILSYIYIAVSTLISVFVSSFYLAMLGEVHFGVYQIMTSFANYLVILNFGISTIMVKNIATFRTNNDLDGEEKSISTILTITVLISALMLLTTFVFYFMLDGIYSHSLTADQIRMSKPMFLIMCFNVVATLWTQSFEGVILGYEKFYFAKMLMLVRLLIRTALVVALLFFYRNAMVIVAIDFIMTLLTILTEYIYCRRRFAPRIILTRFDIAVFRSSFPLALALLLQTLVNQANNSIPTFIVGITLSPKVVTLFSIAMFIYSTFSTIATVPLSIYMPQTVREVTQGTDGFHLTEFIIQPSRLLALFSGVVMFGFVCLGKPFITILYGSQYLEAWTISLIIMVPMYVNMFTGMIVNILNATGRRLYRSLVLLGTTLINIVLTVVLIDRIGVIGAAISTGATTLLGQVLIMNEYYRKRMHMRISYLYCQVNKGILPCFLISSTVVFVFSEWLPINLLTFVVEGLLFVALTSLLLWAFGLNSVEKSQVFHSFQRKRRRS